MTVSSLIGLPVDLEHVRAAATRIAGGVVRTPSAASRTLSAALHSKVILKYENFQFTASFKERGARNRLLQLSPDECRRGVVAVSAGNHAQAVAYHAKLLGIPATIVMPATTPFVKVSRTQQLGADVELCGASLEEAFQRGGEHVTDGLVLVHPFDDAAVIAGQGTVTLELLADHPELDTIVVPVGGGGLLAGIGAVVRELRPDLRLVGAQTAAYSGLARRFHNQHGDEVCGSTIAEGIAVARIGTISGPLALRTASDIVTFPKPVSRTPSTLSSSWRRWSSKVRRPQGSRRWSSIPSSSADEQLASS